MIYFNSVLCDMAMEFIRSKSTYDDMKAYNDIIKIRQTIGTLVCVGSSDAEFNDRAQHLDLQLRTQYKEIDALERAVNTFPKTLMQVDNREMPSPNSQIIDRLEFDEKGIILSVLIKHNCVKQDSEFIEKVDDCSQN